jgi:CheY-like chemotaxis protein
MSRVPYGEDSPWLAAGSLQSRILLVEDSADSRLLIQAFLKKTPYYVDIAENGEKAVQMFTSGKYALVLMDMQMPVMNGWAATRAIRQWERERPMRPTPIIALSAYADVKDMQKSLHAGCTAHLTKPVKKMKLLETICKYAAEGP